MSGLLALFIFGCVVESQSAASPPARFEGVELTDSEGHRWAADRATMGPDGLGRGEGVDAALGVDGDGEMTPELKITADHSSWNLQARTILFEGSVVARRADMTLRCDRLSVSLGEEDTIESAEASGGVQVVQGDRTASGEHAKLFAKQGELVLTGTPVVRDGGTSLSGDRVTLWLDDERMECEGCEVIVDNPGIGGP